MSSEDFQNSKSKEPTAAKSASDLLKPIGMTILAVVISFGYGFFARWVFGAPQYSEILGVMTGGFLVLIPLIMGILTVYFSPQTYRQSTWYAVFMPWVSCIATMVGLALAQLEVVICMVMALPIFLPVSSVGGYLTNLFLQRAAAEQNEPPSAVANQMLGLFLLVPYLITPLENSLAVSESFYVVENHVVINASVEEVWPNILRVHEIQAHEQQPSFFHWLGAPRPIEATMDYEGIGGVRRGYFEEGLVFVEELTAWEEFRTVGFTIQRDRARSVDAPLTEIDGQFFGMVDGIYQIEPLGDNQVRLRFTSTHRLSTRFNFYGSLWTRWGMWELQQNILEIVKARCEVG